MIRKEGKRRVQNKYTSLDTINRTCQGGAVCFRKPASCERATSQIQAHIWESCVGGEAWEGGREGGETVKIMW